MSSSQLTAESTRTIVHLYRAYLRVITKWPADPIRPTRNMKTALRSQVTESFRSLNNQTDSSVAQRIADAQVQLQALQKITRNEFKQKVPKEEIGKNNTVVTLSNRAKANKTRNFFLPLVSTHSRQSC
jgi:hypothetical protein